MKYKEFVSWCNERACDGMWGYTHVVICTRTMEKIRKLPFWKRKKEWEKVEPDILDCVVNPVNQKIDELLEK